MNPPYLPPTRHPKGEAHHNARLTPATVRAIRFKRSQGFRIKEIAAVFGLTPGHTSNIANRRLWAHVA